MTLREQAVCAAITGLLANPDCVMDMSVSEIAQSAVAHADAVIAALGSDAGEREEPVDRLLADMLADSDRDLASVREQLTQTEAERDKLAKRVAELEVCVAAWQELCRDARDGILETGLNDIYGRLSMALNRAGGMTEPREADPMSTEQEIVKKRQARLAIRKWVDNWMWKGEYKRYLDITWGPERIDVLVAMIEQRDKEMAALRTLPLPAETLTVPAELFDAVVNRDIRIEWNPSGYFAYCRGSEQQFGPHATRREAAQAAFLARHRELIEETKESERAE